MSELKERNIFMKTIALVAQALKHRQAACKIIQSLSWLKISQYKNL
jgi:hypothetical protein